MNDMIQILIDKVSQLIAFYNSMVENSKKIHELDDAASDVNVYIAVDNGIDTGKVIYKPSEVSKLEFDNIAGMQLGRMPNSSTIFIEDLNKNILTSLDLSFLNGNNVSLIVNHSTNELQLLDYEGNIISVIPLSDLIIPKTKELFSHILTAGDIANPIIDLTLPNAPDLNEWEFLYINSGAVSPESYSVSGTTLSIDTAKLAYPVQVGRVVTYRYMY